MMRIQSITDPAQVDALPFGISFFQPHFEYYVKEILDTGGEAYMTHDGLFIYDGFERGGSIFAKSRETFDLFYSMKPNSFIFSEMLSEHKHYDYHVYQMMLKDLSRHDFRHEVTLSEDVKSFMHATHDRINPYWVKVALRNGDKCFTVKVKDQIVGAAWVSLVNKIGRLHSLFVMPQFRKLGIGNDLVYARLLWLKANHAERAYSEIIFPNIGSSKAATRAGMVACGQMFEYLT